MYKFFMFLCYDLIGGLFIGIGEDELGFRVL